MAENVFSNASLTGATTVSGSINFSGAQIAGMYKRHVGLGLVDNTSDMDKPISTAVQTALDNILGNANSGGVDDNAVTAAKIADNAVTTGKIDSYAVTETKINTDAVTGEKIKDGAVTTAKLSTGAVTSSRISDGAVTFSKLGADAKISFNNSFAPGLNDVAGKMVITESGGTYTLNICVVSGDYLNTVGTWKSVTLV
jgi:hypothetical protein